jgi:hypothetical protein
MSCDQIPYAGYTRCQGKALGALANELWRDGQFVSL